MGRPWIISGCLLVAWTCAAPARDLAVDVRRDGAVVRLRASADVAAPRVAVWEVLTAYERQARFVPGVTASRVVSRGPGGSVVFQSGVVRVLFLEFPFELEYVTREQPPLRLDSHLLRGSARRMDSVYRLRASAGGTRLDYEGEVEPADWLPPLLGTMAMRRELEARVEALVREAERGEREGARR